MERNVIQDLTHALPRQRRTAIARELRSHLDEIRRDLEEEGWRPADAMREAETRLGDVSEIAAAFEDVYRPSRRSRVGLALALATTMLVTVWGVGGTLASATAARHHSPSYTQVTHRLTGHRSGRNPSGSARLHALHPHDLSIRRGGAPSA